ncbi:MAG: M20/M25/M40 family metallo-hydrolase [Chitinophagaceae bacterium]|uniref:M20/M25/M40 family metallo-hydrolase n=1 Tax=unclassified Paraflavitalea TaxID=2798305 RepID=UPI003D34D715|nr:M20/M25/M40 family metallo-hydrolase [Chitinophagaceae bacterium]
MRKIFLSLALLTAMISLEAQEVDQALVEKIKLEGMQNSKVMEHAFYLTDVNGPRLNNSPNYLKAANWAKAKLQEWGLEANLESWGEWGKGWELKKSYLAITAPYYKPIIAFPKAWCSGTKGLKKAEVIVVDAKDSIQLQAYAGKLKGKIIIVPRTDSLKQSFKPDADRFTEEALSKMAGFTPPASTGGNGQRGNFNGRPPMFNVNKIKEFAKAEGAIAILSAAPNGKDGTLFVSGGGAYTANAPENFLDIAIAYEDYMTIYRLASRNIPVKLETEVAVAFHTEDTQGYNVVAEIKGTDPKLKDELVIIGGHLDSWHAATGATDNAAGCAVMMEVIRIVKAIGLQPKRTIRICLWGGEEQGLHGSRNYVKNHFTDTTTKKFNALGDKISAYYNLDNGTGKIRGIYTQGNTAVKALFSQWLQPFASLGASTVTAQNTGGTDHLAFDAIGVPGFQFIQDRIEYDTRTHHTNMDTYDHLIPEDLKQAATIIAAFVVNTAQQTEKLPRK